MIKPKLAGAPESVHNFLTTKGSALDPFFNPSNVALIGATETPGSVGRTILKNLVSSPFGGTVFPVNPKRPNVLGIKAYPRIADIPEKVDLAVIVTPAPSVPGVIRECVAAGVKASIIISAGFKETGPEGVRLEQQIREEARGKMRIIGPNCLGLMNPLTGLNATFAATMARPGNVAFISQSGALLTAILDWSLRELVGFSAFVSIGSMLDVGWGDLIDYLGDDPQTKSIVIYMETIGNARAFLSAAREVALAKPIIVIKAGRTEGAAKAAASHTGSLTGSDDVLDAAFDRCGVLRVSRIDDLFHMAEVLGKQPRPAGSRLTIITNAGGPGVLATDALIQTGGTLAEVSKDTVQALNGVLPTAWSHNNPIDVLGDASPERYAKALELAGKDPASDGLLVILTPQAMTDATLTGEALKPFAKIPNKPVLASWMGGADVAAGRDILRRADIPVFAYPDEAARAFTYMWQYSRNLRSLYETPSPAPISEEGMTEYLDASRGILEAVRQAGRTLLTEKESKDLLSVYGIPIVKTAIAKTEAQAVKEAETMGFPVVLKLHSETITHKTDVGGVQLNIRNADGVKTAFQTIKKSVEAKASAKAFGGVTVQRMVKLTDGYEIILGSSIDPQFGPVLLFGTGGQLVEVFKDRSLALPPLNTTLARRMMERTTIYGALKGVRGRRAVDLKELERLLVRFSQLVVDHPWIKEIDINPLLCSADEIVALDGRVVLHDPKTKQADLPSVSIRPYPVQYLSTLKLKSAGKVLIRPIRHHDEPLVVKFHETLSERSVYLRYFQTLNLSQRVTHERLLRRCFIDYDREMALVAESKVKATESEILAISRFIRIQDTPNAEFSILVSDKAQRQGLGTELLKRLIEVARQEGIKRLEADILRENGGMHRLCEKLGFTLTGDVKDPTVRAVLTLS
jgi:acetyltransferase